MSIKSFVNWMAKDGRIGENPCNGSRVGAPSKIAEDISGGHAYGKHVVKNGEFPGVKSPGEFAAEIDRVMTNPTHTKSLSKGRTAYWDDKTGTVVIHNPNAADQGTCFRPTDGKAYFDNLK
jgi:filamentous hemagglutinin